MAVLIISIALLSVSDFICTIVIAISPFRIFYILDEFTFFIKPFNPLGILLSLFESPGNKCGERTSSTHQMANACACYFTASIRPDISFRTPLNEGLLADNNFLGMCL